MALPITQKTDSSKTQLINVQAIKTEAVKDEEAQKILNGYSSILKYFNSIKAKPNALTLFFVKRRLKKLVQSEFELYNSFHTPISNIKLVHSTDFVSSYLQNRLGETSYSIFTKISSLTQDGILGEKFREGIYHYSLPRMKKIMPAQQSRLKKTGNLFKLRRRAK